MKLIINGKEEEIPDTVCSIQDLLEHLDMGGKPAAVELNRQLAPKRTHVTTMLNEGDQLEIVTLVGGG